MAKLKMQAVSNPSGGDGLLKTWLVDDVPDFAAAGFPGPGTAIHVAVSSVNGSTVGVGGGGGASYAATSTTSLAIAKNVTRVFVTQSGLSYLPGNRARASSAAGLGSYMEGLVSVYTGGSLTMLVDNIGGSGTHADWNIGIAGDPGAGSQLPQGPNLGNSNDTITPSDTAQYFVLPAATLTGPHSCSINPSSMRESMFCCVRRDDVSANAYDIVNAGTNGGLNEGTTHTFASAPLPIEYWFRYNGADLIFMGENSKP